jgi:hypothetical protein
MQTRQRGAAIQDSAGIRRLNSHESGVFSTENRYMLWRTKVESAGVSDSSLIRSAFDPFLERSSRLQENPMIYK